MKCSRRKVVHTIDDRQIGRAAEQLAGGWQRIHQLWSRRRFLKGVGTAAAAAAAGALGLLVSAADGARAEKPVETGKFVFPRLQFSVYDGTPDIWNVGLGGDVILRRKLRELTNMNVSMEPKVVRLGDFDELCRYPFVFMTSEGYFRLPDKETANLREYLERGGFILADDCVFAAKEDRFFRTYRKLIDSLFVGNPMRHIPPDHEIYHIYFDFGAACSPHMQGVHVHDGKPGAWGLFEPGTGRIMTYSDPGDMHCGWMCRFWGMEKNIQAIKMGINVIIYFLSH
jgi:hypothetical protein